MQKVIAITGLKGSGKDTIAEIICKHDDSFIPLAFADHLKDIVALMFTWNRDMLSGRFPESREWREKPDEFWSKELGIDFTPRKALTTVGTDLIRGTILEHIWDIIVKKKIIDNPMTNFVITDCRFPNEISVLRNLDAVIIEVQRGELPNWYNIAKSYNLGEFGIDLPKELESIHPSERDWIGLNNPQYIFYNNGTLEDLEKEVVKYFELTER